MFTVIILVFHSKACVYVLSVVSVSYKAIYVPIVMYGLGLFVVVLQEMHCLLNCFHIGMVRV